MNDLKRSIGKEVSSTRWTALYCFLGAVAFGLAAAGMFALIASTGGSATPFVLGCMEFTAGACIGAGIDFVGFTGISLASSESLAGVKNQVNRIEDSLQVLYEEKQRLQAELTQAQF